MSTNPLILGRDLLTALGLDLNFSENVIIGGEGPYEVFSSPMVDVRNYNFKSIKDTTVKPEESFVKLYVDTISESYSAIKSTFRMRRIIYAKYKKADQNKVMTKQCQKHLTSKERHRLLQLLKKFEDLYNGTLSTWKTTLVDLELKDNVKPVCLRTYPVPKLHEKMFKKEVKRLLSLGVLKEANESEWGAPYFEQPKVKTNRVIFLSDFRNLNRQLKRKPYPMPKIREMLSNLEGFQYARSLDLNMGYYHIRLSYQASNLCTIILPWAKYRYKLLPMGVSYYQDISRIK